MHGGALGLLQGEETTDLRRFRAVAPGLFPGVLSGPSPAQALHNQIPGSMDSIKNPPRSLGAFLWTTAGSGAALGDPVKQRHHLPLDVPALQGSRPGQAVLLGRRQLSAWGQGPIRSGWTSVPNLSLRRWLIAPCGDLPGRAGRGPAGQSCVLPGSVSSCKTGTLREEGEQVCRLKKKGSSGLFPPIALFSVFLGNTDFL